MSGDKRSRFWDKVAEKYSKKPIADEAAYEKKLEETRKVLEPYMKVLELGCGTGGTALKHAPYVRHVRATDISPAMIDIARQRADEASVSNVSFEVGAVDTIGVDDQSVDVVFALSLLHLLEDRDAALERIHRMLKADGLLVSSTPCLGDFFKLFAVIGPIGRALGFFPMVRVFSAADLKASLEEAGFETQFEWQPSRNKPLFVIARKT